MTTQVHFVGSVPLTDAEDVLRTISATVGARAPRMPDGETGAKQGWIMNQHRVFAQHPAFEKYDAESDWRTPGVRRQKYRLKADAAPPTAASLGSLGYGDWAKESYATFARLKRDGAIPNTVKLQIAIPSPYDTLNYALDHNDIPKLQRTYEECLFAEVGRIVAAVPNDELAIQWDCAHEFEYIATKSPAFFAMPQDEMVALLVRLGRSVPPSVELGYHCCYGNFKLKHFCEPTDTADMVAVMNAVFAKLDRPVQFVHMPVPVDRTDDAYFAPLKGFKPKPGTHLYLGLVHDKDGVAGALKRASAARKVVANFGIATECGLEQRTRDNIAQILAIHRDTAAELDKAPAVR